MIPYNFIFDVDGTISPSRQSITPVFEMFFKGFIKTNNSWLITGGGYKQTYQQLGEDICRSVRAIYNCCGSNIWADGTERYKSDWKLPNDIESWLEKRGKESKFVGKTDIHVEHRTGMVNFCIVGKNATLADRKRYINWDNKTNERKKISRDFNKNFNEYGVVAQIAGETGFDVMPTNSNKATILRDVSAPIIFFGDKTKPGGNDYPLAKALKHRNDSHVITVNSWKDTQKHLKKIIKIFNKNNINGLQNYLNSL